jgi:hypothetical protein
MEYYINQKVEINNTSKIVTIIDFEVFGDLILYYTDDKSAYPEGELNQIGFYAINKILNTSREEKNRQYQEFKKNFKLL